MSSPQILCIETSAGICSVAIGKGTTVLYQAVEFRKNSAADRLQALIAEALSNTELRFSDLDAIAVSGGPGSYTGLRIGVATAKGIAYALGKPLIHIESFQAMKEQLKFEIEEEFDVYIPLLDARRMDAFTCVMDKDGQYITSPECITIEEHTFDKWGEAGNRVLVFGQALDKFKTLLQDKFFGFEDQIILKAASMVRLASEKFDKKQFEDVAYYEPKYYKSFHSSIK